MFQFYHYHAQLYSYSLNPDIPYTFQSHVSCTCTLQIQSVLHLKLYLATVLEQVLCRFELQLVFLILIFHPVSWSQNIALPSLHLMIHPKAADVGGMFSGPTNLKLMATF